MGAQKKILIVEDDDEIRMRIKNKLLHTLEIFEARDGEDAVAKWVDNRPDLVLLDLLLPKLSGVNVLERIRKYPDPLLAKTRVIVLSNLWSQKDILQVQGLKVDEYFVKAHTKLEDVIIKINGILAS